MNIQNEILEIKARNKRVEADKAWETSFTRKIIVAVLTYLVVVLFFFVMGLERPWPNAIVPTLAFIISTTTLPLFKNLWIRFFYNKK